MVRNVDEIQTQRSFNFHRFTPFTIHHFTSIGSNWGTAKWTVYYSSLSCDGLSLMLARLESWTSRQYWIHMKTMQFSRSHSKGVKPLGIRPLTKLKWKTSSTCESDLIDLITFVMIACDILIYFVLVLVFFYFLILFFRHVIKNRWAKFSRCKYLYSEWTIRCIYVGLGCCHHIHERNDRFCFSRDAVVDLLQI